MTYVDQITDILPIPHSSRYVATLNGSDPWVWTAFLDLTSRYTVRLACWNETTSPIRYRSGTRPYR